MNDDSFEDLWSRLDSIPDDLELFFKHILESVEPFYHTKQADCLQIALAANGPLRIEVYTFHETGYSNPDYALTQAVRPMGREALLKLEKSLAKRLNARCKGLLEIRNQNVDFLHRTVRDFLRTGEMTVFLGQRTTRLFNPNISILRAHMAWLKTSKFATDYLSTAPDGPLSFASRLWEMLGYVRTVELQNEHDQQQSIRLLDDLELSVQMMVLGRQVLPTRADETSPHGTANTGGVHSFFREILISRDVAHYTSHKLSQEPLYLDDLELDPLYLSLRTFTPTTDGGTAIQQLDHTNQATSSRGSLQTLKLLLSTADGPANAPSRHP